MGFFDPAYRKMLDKSPTYFRNSAQLWGTVIEAAIITNNLSAAGDVFRAMVIGHLAIRASKEMPAHWSADSIRYIEMATQNARRALPEMVHIVALTTATTIYRMADDQSGDG